MMQDTCTNMGIFFYKYKGGGRAKDRANILAVLHISISAKVFSLLTLLCPLSSRFLFQRYAPSGKKNCPDYHNPAYPWGMNKPHRVSHHTTQVGTQSNPEIESSNING